MIAKPAPILSQGEDKKVFLENGTHEGKPVLRFRIKRRADDLAELRIEFIRERSAYQEFAHGPGLVVENLTTEIGKSVHTGNTCNPRQIGKDHARDPSPGLLDELAG